MPQYDDALALRKARDLYFAQNGLGDGGYDARWVRLQAGPLPLYLLNINARVRAVRFHDLHHVLTGYDTSWTGEAEIGTWEIGSGCAHHYVAWILNLQALAIGLFIAPRAVFRSYVRGRRSANLYRRRFDEELLATRVGGMRRQLRLDRDPGAPRPSDTLTFALWSVLGFPALLLSIALPLAPFLLVYLALRA